MTNFLSQLRKLHPTGNITGQELESRNFCKEEKNNSEHVLNVILKEREREREYAWVLLLVRQMCGGPIHWTFIRGLAIFVGGPASCKGPAFKYSA